MDQASELGKNVLREVSRSFYLSLRVLPSSFREPASVGYLLARISDTIADTDAVKEAERVELLAEFCGLVKGEGDSSRFVERVAERFLGEQQHEGERVLMENSALCLRWLSELGGEQQELIRVLLGQITEGQCWDLERFGGEEVVRLSDEEELKRYAYLVAGSVGEFWTDLGFLLDGEFSEIPQEELRETGRRYGMGLQLVNILRDIPEDLEKGRCYLPGEGGVEPEELLEAMLVWRKRAAGWLGDGLHYAGSVRGARIRFASGLPAMIGLRTLDLLKTADWEALVGRVKVPRSAVRSCAWQALIASLASGPERWI